MGTNLEGRLIRLEIEKKKLEDAVQRLQAAVDALRTAARQQPAAGYGTPDTTRGTGFVAVAEVPISARSGATPGTGTVARSKDSGGSIVGGGATGLVVAVASDLTTAGGNAIDAGTYCWCDYDVFGTLWATALERI